jgi:hypothetical protein
MAGQLDQEDDDEERHHGGRDLRGKETDGRSSDEERNVFI